MGDDYKDYLFIGCKYRQYSSFWPVEKAVISTQTFNNKFLSIVNSWLLMEENLNLNKYFVWLSNHLALPIFKSITGTLHAIVFSVFIKKMHSFSMVTGNALTRFKFRAQVTNPLPYLSFALQYFSLWTSTVRGSRSFQFNISLLSCLRIRLKLQIL